MNCKCYKYWGVVILASVALFILCGMVYGLREPSNSFTVSNVELNSVYMLRNADGVGMNVSFRIHNPSSSDLVLRDVKYYVSVDGTEVKEVGGSELVLGPSTSKEITVTIRIISNDTLALIINSLQKGTMNIGVKVEGQEPVKWYGITDFSVREATAETASVVNVSQILAAEESRVGPVNANKPLAEGEGPLIQVVSVKWYVNGREVTEVKPGTKVTLRVTVKALKDLKHIQLNAYIIDDYKILPDVVQKHMQTYVNLKKGQIGLYSFTFTAEHHWLLKGYYAQITITERTLKGSKPSTPEEGTYYKTPNHYPPRLKVKE